MSPDYLAVLRAVGDLHRLAIDGREDSPEADAIRDAADAPWGRLTEAERAKIGALSEGLRSHGTMNTQERSRIVIVPSDPPPGDPEGGVWSVTFEGFEAEAPVPRGWRGTLAEVLDKVKYVATNRDLTAGRLHDPGRAEPAPWYEEWRGRVRRFQAFWERYVDDCEARAERDRLRTEVADLRAMLTSAEADRTGVLRS